jgi:hypothetical protein
VTDLGGDMLSRFQLIHLLGSSFCNFKNNSFAFFLASSVRSWLKIVLLRASKTVCHSVSVRVKLDLLLFIIYTCNFRPVIKFLFLKCAKTIYYCMMLLSMTLFFYGSSMIRHYLLRNSRRCY